MGTSVARRMKTIAGIDGATLRPDNLRASISPPSAALRIYGGSNLMGVRSYALATTVDRGSAAPIDPRYVAFPGMQAGTAFWCRDGGTSELAILAVYHGRNTFPR
jgi:hypothetical protein